MKKKMISGFYWKFVNKKDASGRLKLHVEIWERGKDNNYFFKSLGTADHCVKKYFKEV